MSTVIDQKVVEMRFDNGQFEQGVNQSISSIDKLKQSLNLSTTSSAAKETLGVIVEGFDSFGSSLDRAMARLKDNIWAKVGTVLKGLTIDNVSEGWKKYGTLMDSVQTIMSATRQEWADQGAQMEYVTGQIEKLNWYTDETSWKLVDMTSNIGKFVSAGVDIETATTAMIGIGSWAGQSGAKVDQMSRAMYNLSQAMAMGSVRVQDWMSIENANMATKEFKDTVIQTALQMGKLHYTSDGAIAAYNEFGKEVVVTAEKFRNTLSAGWFTGDVLTAALKKYGDFAEGLNKTVNETGATATELLGYIDDYKKALADGEDMTKWVQDLAAKENIVNVKALSEGLEYLSNDYNELGRSAFKASQECKTFNDLQLAMKDAVSSAWMGIFQAIVGNYLEAKELWTAIAEELYEVFVDPLNEAKRILLQFGDVGGREAVLESMWNTWYSIKDIVMAVKEGFETLFPASTALSLLKVVYQIRDMTEGFKKALVDTPVYEGVFRLYSPLQNIKDAVAAIMNVVKNLWKNIQTIAGAAGDAWNRIFPEKLHITEALKNVAEWLEKVSEKFVLSEESAAKLERTFAGFFAIIDILKELILALVEPFAEVEEGENGLISGTLSVTATIGDWIVMLRDWLKENDVFRVAVGTVVSFIQSIPGKLDKVCQDLFNMGLDELWVKIKDAVSVAWAAIVNFFTNLPTYADQASQAIFGMHLEDLWDKIKEGATAAWEKLKEIFAWLRENLGKMFTPKDGGSLEETGEQFNQTVQNVSSGLDKIRDTWKDVKPYIDEFFNSFKASTDFEMPSMEDIGKGLAGGGAFVILVAIADAILTFTSALKELSNDKEKIVSSISGMFDSIGGAFKSLSKRISADTIKTIATAILELAAAIFILTILDQDKMLMSTLVIGGLLAELALIMEEFDGLEMDKKKFSQIKAVLAEMMLLIGEITAAMVVVSKEADPATAAITAGMIGVLIGELAAIVIAFDKLDIDGGQVAKASAAMILMGMSMIEISAALSMVATLPIEGIIAGALGISAVMVIMAIVMASLAEAEGNIMKASAASALMGIALMEIAVSLAIVANLPVEGLIAGALGLSALFVILAVALSLLAESQGNIMKAAAAMTVAGVGIVLMAAALAVLSGVVESGNMWETLLLLAVALAALLAAGAAAMYIGPGLEALGIAMALLGVGALAAGTGMYLFASGVEKLVSVGPDGIMLMIQGIVNFFDVLPNMAVRVGEALVGFIKVFIDSKDTLLTGLNTLIDIILDALITAIPKFLTLIETLTVGIIDMIITLLPKFEELIGKLFDMLIRLIWEQTPVLIDTVIMLTRELLRSLLTLTPEITAGAIELLLDTLHQLADNIGEVVSLLTQIAIETILGSIDGITAELPHIMESIWNFVITLIETFADGLDEHAVELRNAIIHLMESLWNAIKEFFGIHSPSTKFFDMAGDMIQGMIDGLKAMIEKAKEAITELADKVLTKICDFFGVKKPGDANEFLNLGKTIINKFIDGIKDKIEAAKEKIKELADAVLTKICDFFGIKKPESQNEFLNLGKTIIQKFNQGIYNMITKAKNMIQDFAKKVLNAVCSFFGIETPDSVGELYSIARQLINGFISGIQSKVTSAINTVGSFCEDVIDKCKNVFKVASPSKVFIEIGKFLDEGLATGISRYSSYVENASEDVAFTSIDAVSEALDRIYNLADEDLDGDPVIKPVLDLTDVINGANAINGMLSGDRSMSLAANTSGVVNSNIAAQHASASAFDQLRNTLSGITLGEGNSMVQNNTFNISGTDPKQMAEEINKILHTQMERGDAVWA